MERYRSKATLRLFGADEQGVIATEVLADCDTSRVVAVEWSTSSQRTLVARGSVLALSPNLTRTLVQIPRDPRHPHGQLAVLARSGKTVEMLGYHVDSADITASGRTVFDQPHLDQNGFATSNTLHVTSDGLGRALRHDVRNDGGLHWNAAGTAFVMQQPVSPVGTTERAVYCRASTFACLSLPLTWTTEVQLVAVVDSAALA